MAIQFLNVEKLENKKTLLEKYKNNINDYLEQIKTEYLNLILKDYWWGHRSDVFFDSLKFYWYSSNPNNGIIGNINKDFDNMITFIQNAIDSSLGKDEEVAKDFEKTVQPSKETSGESKSPATIPVVPAAPKEDEKSGVDVDEIENSDVPKNKPTPTTGKLKYLDGGNIIDPVAPVAYGPKYNLTQEELNYLAYVAYQEQSSIGGAKIEMSLMANLYEANKGKYADVEDYVRNSSWFAASSKRNYTYPGDELVDIANEVFNEGTRYIPANVVEHDYIGDITSVTVNGKSIDPSNRSAYVPYETVIKNCYGSTYTFVGFAPTSEWGVKGDPFGYIS